MLPTDRTLNTSISTQNSQSLLFESVFKITSVVPSSIHLEDEIISSCSATGPGGNCVGSCGCNEDDDDDDDNEDG